jgi:hypothetical protein
VVIRDSTAYGNVAGIEVENSASVEIFQNHIYDNSMGISVFLLPNMSCSTVLNQNSWGMHLNFEDYFASPPNHPS